MKIQCCPLPTSIFSNHTGYDSFYYTDFTQHMDAYIDEWSKLGLKFEGILTGFLGSTEQIEIVMRFFERFKSDGTIIVVDPVMGDGGALYPTYSEKLASLMKTLLPYADIVTPNLTEACILTDTPYNPDMTTDGLFEICEKLSAMGPERIVISGVECGDDLENFIFERGKTARTVKEHKVGSCRAGTGDVFSSIIAADAVKGVGLFESVSHASSFIAKSLRYTSLLGIAKPDGICFEQYLDEL